MTPKKKDNLLLQSKTSMLSQRGQMFVMATALFVCLAAWSLSAFWQHIDGLQPTYRWGARWGAAGGEVAIFIFIILHCFNKHIGVRKWSLILGSLLAALIVVHSGALRGLDEAEVKQADTEHRLVETLTQMSKEQAEGVAESNAKISANRRQRERLAMADKSHAQQLEIAQAAQERAAREITGRAEKIKDSSIFPRWYLNGWMYSLIFVASLAAFGFVCLQMMNREDIDANFDGIPDRLQKEKDGDWIPRSLDANGNERKDPSRQEQLPIGERLSG